jgi:hypothetical protein
MRVVEIKTTQNQRWYVPLDEDDQLVIPAVRYLKHLNQRGYARNILRSYRWPGITQAVMKCKVAVISGQGEENKYFLLVFGWLLI